MIPNVSAAAYYGQALVSSQDWEIHAATFRGDGVKTGCGITAQGTPNMTVAGAAGTILWGFAEVACSGDNVTISTADVTKDRVDVITRNNAGALVYAVGVPVLVVPGVAYPEPPALPESGGRANVVLAYVYVPAGVTAITSTMITAKTETIVLQAAASGANTALNNLAAVSINLALLAQVWQTYVRECHAPCKRRCASRSTLGGAGRARRRAEDESARK